MVDQPFNSNQIITYLCTKSGAHLDRGRVNTFDESVYFFIFVFSSSTSNGIEVQAKNILAEWPTHG